MNASPQPGFFGKLFVLGDFVTRRLPHEFVAVWDDWLQGAMAASREQLGGNWLDVYLTSPIWRFGLGPGICGGGAWAGVLMPSVDKVGRHFPLTLAAPVVEADDLPHLFGTAEGEAWFADLEQLALSCLEADFNLDGFDQCLQASALPRFAPVSLSPDAKAGNGGGKFALHVGMQTLEQTPAALVDAGNALLKRFLPTYSLWCSAGSERVGASLLVVEGLPPIDTYVALLTGHWCQRGWAMASAPVRTAQQCEGTGACGTLPDLSPPDIAASADAGDTPANCFFDPDPPTRPRQPVPTWSWRSWGVSVIGMKRKINEDAMLERADAGLWAVADGMGGHQAGDVASQAIVQALAALDACADAREFADRAERSLQAVNDRLFRLAAESGEDGQIIGSTVVVLLAAQEHCVFLWAGDSRLYRFRDGQLLQLTEDHSLFEDFAKQGVLTTGQLAESGRCNIITRAVGASETLALSRDECAANPGDLYLLCSDGLDKELAREEIEAVFRGRVPEKIAAALIEKAEERGARDNVTVVVAGLLLDRP